MCLYNINININIYHLYIISLIKFINIMIYTTILILAIHKLII